MGISENDVEVAVTRESGQVDYAALYRRAHAENPKWFGGSLDPESADTIAALAVKTGARRIIDWGSGRGYQYLADRVHERWGILPFCYDIAVSRLSNPPKPASWDGIICTDVMEHIGKRDIEATLLTIFALLAQDRPVFAYFNIFCNPAIKYFPDGRNVHLTIRPPAWWEQRLAVHKRRNLHLHIDYVYTVDS